VWVWGSVFVLCVGQFFCGIGGVSIYCVWDSLVWVCGSEYALCVRQFGDGLGKLVFAMCVSV